MFSVDPTFMFSVDPTRADYSGDKAHRNRLEPARSSLPKPELLIRERGMYYNPFQLCLVFVQITNVTALSLLS